MISSLVYQKVPSFQWLTSLLLSSAKARANHLLLGPGGPIKNESWPKLSFCKSHRICFNESWNIKVTRAKDLFLPVLKMSIDPYAQVFMQDHLYNQKIDKSCNVTLWKCQISFLTILLRSLIFRIITCKFHKHVRAVKNR